MCGGIAAEKNAPIGTLPDPERLSAGRLDVRSRGDAEAVSYLIMISIQGQQMRHESPVVVLLQLQGMEASNAHAEMRWFHATENGEVLR
jgi:hypothetical protein